MGSIMNGVARNSLVLRSLETGITFSNQNKGVTRQYLLKRLQQTDAFLNLGLYLRVETFGENTVLSKSSSTAMASIASQALIGGILTYRNVMVSGHLFTLDGSRGFFRCQANCLRRPW